MASVAGRLLNDINTFPSRFVSYLDPMSTVTNAPNECPIPYTGNASYPSTVFRSALAHRSYFCHASSANRKWSNPNCTGVAITSASARATNVSQNSPYVTCGDAPTNAPPQKCTIDVGARPSRGRSTYASSTRSHPLASDDAFPNLAASASARSKDENASDRSLDDVDEDDDASRPPLERAVSSSALDVSVVGVESVARGVGARESAIVVRARVIRVTSTTRGRRVGRARGGDIKHGP
jgi:hypothetical protein